MNESLYSNSPYIIIATFIALFAAIFYNKILKLDTKSKNFPKPINEVIHINIVWNACSIIGSLFFSGLGYSIPRQILFSIQALAWVQMGYATFKLVCINTNNIENPFFKIWNTFGICTVLLFSIFSIFDIRIISEMEIFGHQLLKDYPVYTIFATTFIIFVVFPIISSMYLMFRTCIQISNAIMMQISTSNLVFFIVTVLLAYSFDFILPIVNNGPVMTDNKHFLFWSQIGCMFVTFLAGVYYSSITYKNKSSQWLLERITKQIHDGIIYYYPDGRIKSASPSALQLLQTSLDDLQTKYIQELFPKNIELFRESHYKSQNVSIRGEIHKFNINIYQNHLSMTSIEYIIHFSDITNTLYYQQRIKELNKQYVEYKQDLIRYQNSLNISEKRSDENKNFLFTLINALPFQFWSKNEQGVYVAQNQKDIIHRGNRLTSFDSPDTITEYENEARLNGISKSFSSFETSSGLNITQDEANVRFREGKEVLTFDNLFIPIVIGISPYKVIGLKINTTEQRKLEKERDMLREQKYIHSRLEELGTLCGAFAHDYNNIIGSQIGFCDLALESIQDNHPAYLFINEARKAAERGKQSLEELLSTIRGNTETVIPSIEFSPFLIIKDIVARFTQSLPQNIQIDSTDIDENIKIWGIVASFERILTNIVKNGIDAMKTTGGKLSISLHANELTETLDIPYAAPIPAGSYAKISIADTGSGMDASTLERIFSPFFTTKAPGEGLGLGLSSAVRLLKEAKASFNVETTLNKGTTFNLYWPK